MKGLRRRGWLAAVLCLPLLARAQASAAQPQTGVAIGAKTAEAAFLRFWAEWSARPQNADSAESLRELVRAGSPSRKLRAGSACRDTVIDRLGAVPPAEALLHGSLAEVAAAARCWEIVYDGRLGGGLVACVDARRGRVLLVWRTPGG